LEAAAEPPAPEAVTRPSEGPEPAKKKANEGKNKEEEDDRYVL
jgi:hypothetical protein